MARSRWTPLEPTFLGLMKANGDEWHDNNLLVEVLRRNDVDQFDVRHFDSDASARGRAFVRARGRRGLRVRGVVITDAVQLLIPLSGRPDLDYRDYEIHMLKNEAATVGSVLRTLCFFARVFLFFVLFFLSEQMGVLVLNTNKSVGALLHSLGHMMGGAIGYLSSITTPPDGKSRPKPIVFPRKLVADLKKKLTRSAAVNPRRMTSSAASRRSLAFTVDLSYDETVQIWGECNCEVERDNGHKLKVYNVSLEFKPGTIDKLVLRFSVREYDRRGRIVSMVQADREMKEEDVSNMIRGAVL